MKACMGVHMPFEVGLPFEAGWMVTVQKHQTLDNAAFKIRSSGVA